MPSARCTQCNKTHPYRNCRGAKLSNMRCVCGGALESLGGTHTLTGSHPLDPEKTYTSKWYDGPYFYADKNRKGEYFVFHDGYWHKVENPVLGIIKTV
jgi:hypothetical protein